MKGEVPAPELLNFYSLNQLELDLAGSDIGNNSILNEIEICFCLM